jgi:GLPGLI family protein
MIKYITPLLLFLVSLPALAQKDTIGVSKFTAIYRYECKSTDAAGQPVTDSMLIAVQTSDGITKCFPYDEYNTQKSGSFRVADGYQAALMHLGTVYLNYPEGRITTHEMLYPYRYQTDEALEKPKWELTDGQDSIFGYACESAKTKYHGLVWKAYYTEDIPSGVGPWKLGGLPGLITKATDANGVHSFTLCGLLKEEQPIVFMEYITWIVPNDRGQFVKQRVDYQKMPADKFLAYKKKVLGNPRYLKEPTYYAPDPMQAFGYVETSWNSAGDNIRSVAGVVLIPNPRQYQPLELK